MKTVSRKNLPPDFSYYRTGSKVFYDYYKTINHLIVHRMSSGYEFLKAGRIYKNFYSIIVEKIDQEPTRNLLESLGICHGIIFWGPMRLVNKPKGWMRIPSFLVPLFFHSSRSAFSLLDRPDYWGKWSPKAKNHRRKVLKNKELGVIRIEKTKDPKQYLDTYKATKISDPYKEYLIRWLEKMILPDIHENLNVYLAWVNGKILAGAVFIDEGVTSEYFTSFYHKESKPFHLGIALLDQWFYDSYAKGIKYCDLDHMWDTFSSKSTRGYTKFKESIADSDIFFRDMWIKIF